MTNYEKGRQKEAEFVKFLKYNGWLAMRSAGSHSEFDVAAAAPHQNKPVSLFVQIGPKTREELKRLRDCTTWYHGIFAHCWYNNGIPLMINLDDPDGMYMQPHEFLIKYCGSPGNDTIKYFPAVREQTILDREQRKLKKQQRATQVA